MRRNTHRLAPFVALAWKMLNSEAYRELSPMSAKILPFFLGKVKTVSTDLAYYTTTFNFTYSEATRYGCSRRTFPRVIDDLMRHGFVDPVEKGGLRAAGSHRIHLSCPHDGNSTAHRILQSWYGDHSIRMRFVVKRRNAHVQGQKWRLGRYPNEAFKGNYGACRTPPREFPKGNYGAHIYI